MSTRSFLSAGALDTVPVEVPREVPVEGPEATELRTEPALAPIEPTRIEAIEPAPSVPLEPVREASLAAPRRSSWILYALVAAGVLGAAAFWLIGKRPPALETNAGPAPASAASVDAPVVEDTVPATSNASTVASTAPSSQPSHTRPAKSVDPFANAPPFSTFLAENAVRERAKFAVQQCSAHEGPRSLPLSVVFGNDGRVKRVEMSDQLRFQSSGICVFQAMSFIIIPSFSGPEGRVSTTVTLP